MVDTNIVDVKNLVINYGKHQAVKGISFNVAPGESVGLLGSNGAGKSSTLKSIACINPPTSGEVLIDGLNTSNPRLAEQARHLIGYCPDVGGLIKTATIREHIALTLALHDKTSLWSQALEIVEAYELINFLDSACSGFSHGMSRRLSTILAIISSQKLLILDEPFDGVDPSGVEITMHYIREAKKSGVSVIISTHLQRLLADSSDRILIMKEGEILANEEASIFQGDAGEEHYRNLLQTNNPHPLLP